MSWMGLVTIEDIEVWSVNGEVVGGNEKGKCVHDQVYLSFSSSICTEFGTSGYIQTTSFQCILLYTIISSPRYNDVREPRP